MSRRYYPGYMNREEYAREQMRQEDMVNSIMRGARERDEQEALGSLSELLQVLEIVAQDLAETITALRKQQTETGAKLHENALNP